MRWRMAGSAFHCATWVNSSRSADAEAPLLSGVNYFCRPCCLSWKGYPSASPRCCREQGSGRHARLILRSRLILGARCTASGLTRRALQGSGENRTHVAVERRTSVAHGQEHTSEERTLQFIRYCPQVGRHEIAVRKFMHEEQRRGGRAGATSPTSTKSGAVPPPARNGAVPLEPFKVTQASPRWRSRSRTQDDERRGVAIP
jgi:hypothetical protein